MLVVNSSEASVGARVLVSVGVVRGAGARRALLPGHRLRGNFLAVGEQTHVHLSVELIPDWLLLAF